MHCQGIDDIDGLDHAVKSCGIWQNILLVSANIIVIFKSIVILVDGFLFICEAMGQCGAVNGLHVPTNGLIH